MITLVPSNKSQSVVHITLTSLFLFACVSLSLAHIPPSASVLPLAKVERVVIDDDQYIRASAYISASTGNHNEDHLHRGSYYLHIYLVPQFGDPGNAPHSVFEYKPAYNVPLSGQASMTDLLTDLRSLMSGCWTGGAMATGSIWTDGLSDHLTDTDNDGATICPLGASQATSNGTPNNLAQIKEEISDAITFDEEGTNAALYLNGSIYSMNFDPNNTVYVHEENGVTFTLGKASLVRAHNNARLGAGANVVQLDSLDSEVSHAAPPRIKLTRRILTTTWASMKQR